MARSQLFIGIILFFCTTGPMLRADDPAPADDLKKLVAQYAFKQKPKLRPDAQFKIDEYQIDGLAALKIQVLLVRYLSKDGSQFNEALLIHHEGKLEPLASTLGGHGLMSAVVSDGKLYYTNSSGSGRHRSHVGQLSIVKGEAVFAASGPVLDEDLFVKKAGDSIVVEQGSFQQFNAWASAKPIGTISPKETGFAVLDDMKNEIAKLTAKVSERTDAKK